MKSSGLSLKNGYGPWVWVMKKKGPEQTLFWLINFTTRTGLWVLSENYLSFSSHPKPFFFSLPEIPKFFFLLLLLLLRWKWILYQMATLPRAHHWFLRQRTLSRRSLASWLSRWGWSTNFLESHSSTTRRRSEPTTASSRKRCPPSYPESQMPPTATTCRVTKLLTI